MILEAIRHTGTYPDIYLKDRRTLVVMLRTARKDANGSRICYFARTSPEERNTVPLKIVLRDDLFDYYSAEIEFSQVARYQKYYFEISYGNQTVYAAAKGVQQTRPADGYFEFLYANNTEIITVPQWSRGQVYYQIFPERYKNGDPSNDPQHCEPWETAPTPENYMGGDLKGILEKLTYIRELGTDCIYLNPIFEADFNHKYATTDYFRVDPAFGTDEDLRELIDRIHGYGMKIVLDGVFNHTGIHFPPFADLLKNQENSQYRDWFHITRFPVDITHHNYECVGAYKYMPKLNTANPEVREYILSVMEYWIDQFHIDGWRLDVADEVDESVWMEARLRLKRKYPDIMLLGETWGSGQRLMNGTQMDGIMNYVFRDAVRDYIALEKIDAASFDARTQRMLSMYPWDMNEAMFLPLGSHDTERFLFCCGGDKRKMKLAVFLQMGFVGAPSVYYGDEIGMTGDNDPDCRRCMIWEENQQDQELLSLYRQLIRIRHREECIKHGRFAVNVCEGRVYGFLRYTDEEAVYIVMNCQEEERTVILPVLYKSDHIDLIDKKQYQVLEGTYGDYYNADMNCYEGILEVKLGAYEARMMKGAIW